MKREERKLLTEKEIKDYVQKIVGSRKCDIIDHYFVKELKDGVVIKTGTEVISVTPEPRSFNIHCYYLKNIDCLSSNAVDIFMPILRLRFIIHLHKPPVNVEGPVKKVEESHVIQKQTNKFEFKWMNIFNEKWNEYVTSLNPPGDLIKGLKLTAEMFFGEGYYAGEDEMLSSWEKHVKNIKKDVKNTITK